MYAKHFGIKSGSPPDGQPLARRLRLDSGLGGALNERERWTLRLRHLAVKPTLTSMNNDDAARIHDAVKDVVSKLANGEYDELAQKTDANRLTANEIERSILDYGIELSKDIDALQDSYSVYESSESSPRYWGIDFDLVDLSKGRSDLTLKMTFTENGPGALDIRIDDIRVL